MAYKTVGKLHRCFCIGLFPMGAKVINQYILYYFALPNEEKTIIAYYETLTFIIILFIIILNKFDQMCCENMTGSILCFI